MVGISKHRSGVFTGSVPQLFVRGDPLEMVFEHRGYLPSMMLFAPAALLAVRTLAIFGSRPKMRLAMAMGMALVLAAQGHTTYIRNWLFSDEITLWSDTAAKAPGLDRPHMNLGKALLEAGMLEAGAAELEEAIGARTDAQKTAKAKAHHNLAKYYLFMGELDQAESHLAQALAIDPALVPVYDALAQVNIGRNALTEAEQFLQPALAMAPDSAQPHRTYAVMLLKAGRSVEAQVEAETALRLEPEATSPLYLLGEAHRARGEYREASARFTEYLLKNEEDRDAQLALIELHSLLGEQEFLRMRALAILTKINAAELPAVLDTFGRTMNFLDPERPVRIKRAIAEVLRGEAMLLQE